MIFNSISLSIAHFLIYSLTTRRRHNPQAPGHSSSSNDIWKRHSQFGPDVKQPPTSSPKVLGRSQSTDSINELAESLLMEVSSIKAMEEESRLHQSRDYFAPLPQMSHQSGNSMYSVSNGSMLNHSNGDPKSMVIMPNLQPNRYQMQTPQVPQPSPMMNHQPSLEHHRELQQQSHYQQMNGQQVSTPFYYQKQQSFQQPSQVFTPAVGAQSLPYMSRSISVDSYSPASPSIQQNTNANNDSSVPPFSKKIPRNCELEEYARRYEALQRQSSARRRSSREQKKKQLQQQQQMENNNGPKSLQHHLPLNGAKSCPDSNFNNNPKFNSNMQNMQDNDRDAIAKVHMRSTLLRKYSNDLWNIGSGQQGNFTNGDGLPNRESGRESVSTILSNSSSETVRYQDSCVSQNGGNHDSQYHSMHAFLEEHKENTITNGVVANGLVKNGHTSTRGSKQPMSISEFAFNDTSNPMPPASLSWQKEKEKTLQCDNNNKALSKDNSDVLDGGSDALYASLNFGNVEQQNVSNQQYASMSYLQSNSSMKDLKRFPVQTYANGNDSNESGYDESGYSMIQFGNHSNNSGMTRTTLRQRKQASKGHAASDDILQHSKSVPNLSTEKQNEGALNQDEIGSPIENTFSYLDPEKRLKVSDNTLKLIQKQALRDYYERHNTLSKKSSASQNSSNAKNN